MQFSHLRLRVGFAFGGLLTFLSVGCGVATAPPKTPQTAVAATQNPLVADYQINSIGSGSVWVEFGTDTSYGRQTSSISTGGTNNANGAPAAIFATKILVAGMKPSTTYHMRAHVDYVNGSTWVDQDRTFTTGALPSMTASLGNNSAAPTAPVPLVRPTINVSVPNAAVAPSPGVELFNLVGGGNMLRAFVTDLQGNIIWYFDPGPDRGSPTPMKLLPNGHFILNVGDLMEIDLAGNIVRDVFYTNINPLLQAKGYSFSITGFHHDMLVLPNGDWIVLCYQLKDFTDLPGYPGVTHVLGDVVIDLDPQGNLVWAWSGFDHLDVNRHPLGLADFEGLGADWTHSNALVYTADGNLLVSMRNQSWILKLDYQNGTGSGNILWKLGEDGDFQLTGGDPTQWFYAQHYPNSLADNGTQSTLAIWDNGDGRLDAGGQPCGTTTACYSRATIFQIDQSTKIATLLWQDLPGFYSFWGGSIDLLASGNVEFDQTSLFGLTAASRVMEVTETSSPQTVWQLDLKGENAYRAYRIPSLYPGVTWKK